MKYENSRPQNGFLNNPIFMWIVFFGILIYWLVSEFFCTVNYTLKNGENVVYHGITKKNRIDRRLEEHIRKGKKFTLMEYEFPLPRRFAMIIEKRRIRRDNPLYNIQHARFSGR